MRFFCKPYGQIHRLKIFDVWKKGQYPFLTANTDSQEKDGTHWWSIHWTKDRSHFFYSFEIEDLKNFIIPDDKKIFVKILSEIKKKVRTNNKLTLVNIKFSIDACRHMSKNELNSLSDTARNFFILFNHLEINSKYVIL